MKEIKIPINNTNSIKEYKSEKSNEIKILWLSIDHLSPTRQILICSGGVFVFYLLYGYLQVKYIDNIIIFFFFNCSY